MAPLRHLNWAFYLVLIVTVVIGWLSAGWLGAAIGIFIGLIAACAAWSVGYYIAIGRFHRKQLREMSQTTTERLREMAMDPASPNLGFAIAELSRRGIEASPDLKSILALLTSPNGNRRGLALSLLVAFYPTISSQLPPGCSNLETDEVWRERLRVMNEAGLLNAPSHERINGQTAVP